MNRHAKLLIVLLYDATAAALSLLFAIALRYDFNLPADVNFLPHAGIYAALCLVGFYLCGVHRCVLHYTSTRDVIRIAAAVCMCVGVGGLMLAIATRFEHFPRSAFIILPLLQIAAASAPRILLRMMHDRRFGMGLPTLGTRLENAILVGMNDTADLFIRETLRQFPRRYNILGVIDDQQPKGRAFHGIPLLGSAADLDHILTHLTDKPTLLILTEPKIAAYRPLIDAATKQGLNIRRVPCLSNLADGSGLTDLKQVMIEDLLGRESVTLDLSSLSTFTSGKTVMVTGAGGSIGSELCRQLAQSGAGKLILVEHSEHALYQIEQELGKNASDTPQVPILTDIRNRADIADVFQKYRPDIVFHAAAYKHVPLVESNPIAGIENNLIGTAVVVDEAISAGVAKVVIISTDKAVNPTNIMGATKRAAESYALWRGTQMGSETTVIAVRFGNVLGSNGSVIPLFKQQLAEGGPLTVTHKDVTRYFMTIPEAVQLVLKAAHHGSSGNLFMLDMGEPVKIWHLAEQMIRLSGLTPHEDILIEEIGLRPGEKLYEELAYDAETMEKTVIDKVHLVKKMETPTKMSDTLRRVIQACETENAAAAVTLLGAMVPEYTPADNSPYANKPTKEH